MSSPAAVFAAIREEAETVVIGNEGVFEGLTIALLTGGNVLLEGVPGVAKTTIANVFARATGLEYRRIQMTPDMVPADITGTTIYRQSTGEFELQRGPVFANVVVADEINRANAEIPECAARSDGRTDRHDRRGDAIVAGAVHGRGNTESIRDGGGFRVTRGPA